MAYCTKSDLEQRFGAREIADLLDPENTGTPDNSRLTSTIADADALIDSYIGSRYSIPLSPVPSIVVGISCNITRYMLWDDRAPDEVRKRYEDSVAQLKDISKGVMTLPSATTPAPDNPSGGVDYVAVARVFTMDTISGF